MKNGIMVAFLTASILLNVFLWSQQKSTPVPPPYSMERFASLEDGEKQVLPFVPPDNPSDNTLVVYLHSMGSNFNEPFDYPRVGDTISSAINDQSIGLISCPCRGREGWARDQVIADITQNIRFALQSFPFKRIVLMGTSMGGCNALTYAALAPDDIKAKLVGVVSVEGAGDFTKLYKLAGHPDVRRSMTIAFGGTPDQIPAAYQKKSVLQNMSKLPPNLRVCVVSAKQDSLVPPELQRDVIAAMEREKRPCKLIEIEGDHGLPAAFLYKQGLDWVLSKI